MRLRDVGVALTIIGLALMIIVSLSPLVFNQRGYEVRVCREVSIEPQSWKTIDFKSESDVLRGLVFSDVPVDAYLICEEGDYIWSAKGVYQAAIDVKRLEGGYHTLKIYNPSSHSTAHVKVYLIEYTEGAMSPPLIEIRPLLIFTGLMLIGLVLIMAGLAMIIIDLIEHLTKRLWQLQA